MLEFSPDEEMKKIASLAEEFYETILDDKLFSVSDEAMVWSVSAAQPEELLAGVSRYYGKTASVADLHQPLWKLIRQLNAERGAAHHYQLLVCSLRNKGRAAP